MNITITGASGFVGVNLQEYLNKSHDVSVLSARYLKNQTFEINTDVLIHLAGKAHDLKRVSKPQDYYDANFELTKQVFDAFLSSSSAKVFIFMSTVKAVSDKVNGLLTEENIPNPKTHYGIAKHQAEEYILNKIPSDKKVYILRPCMIHGPGNKGNLNLLFKIVSLGLPWPLGSFENQRSFLSIENLCFIIEEILRNKNVPSGVYNLADDKSISTNQLIKLIGKALNKNTRILKINSLSIKFIARTGDHLKLPLNTERLDKLTENYVVSNEKILNILQKSLPISTEAGLMKTFQSFKKIK